MDLQSKSEVAMMAPSAEDCYGELCSLAVNKKNLNEKRSPWQ